MSIGAVFFHHPLRSLGTYEMVKGVVNYIPWLCRIGWYITSLKLQKGHLLFTLHCLYYGRLQMENRGTAWFGII